MTNHIFNAVVNDFVRHRNRLFRVTGIVIFHDGIVGEWATAGPTYLFPLWAIALAWATYLYRSRRLRSEAMARALGRKPAQAATETTGRDAASPA